MTDKGMKRDADGKPTGPGPQANTPDSGSPDPKERFSTGDAAEGASGEGYLRDDMGDYGTESKDESRDDRELKNK
ncbi:MAG: hypothetical protein KDG89_00940 [Geminicoccaceae bacterium]|nr:hypothetical protein [Geminicoccaceae bacterium]